jgi:hypothetical protein
MIIKLKVKSPAGTSGTVKVPVRAGPGLTGAKVLINGEQVQGDGTFLVAGGESFVSTLESFSLHRFRKLVLFCEVNIQVNVS